MSAKIHKIGAVSPQAGMEPKLDYLKELSGGDHNFMIEILEMFITDAPNAVEQAGRYLADLNYQMLKITVHKLKSSVQVVGGYYLTHLIQEIENTSRDGADTHALHQMLSHLDHGIQHLTDRLTTELDNLSPQENAA